MSILSEKETNTNFTIVINFPGGHPVDHLPEVYVNGIYGEMLCGICHQYALVDMEIPAERYL